MPGAKFTACEVENVLMGRVLLALVIALVSNLFGALQPSSIAPASLAGASSLGMSRSRPAITTSPRIRRALRPARHRPAPPKPPIVVPSNPVLRYSSPPVLARAAYLLDLGTGRVLYAKNAGERLPMASTTKITTAVVTLQHARLNDLAWVSKRAATIGESTMTLARGERLTVRDLLYGLLLNSANDAAITLAEHVSGNEERFVVLMNRLARKLHMTNTHYVTAHGLDEPNHYTSAHDLAVIARYALRYPVFRQIVRTTSYYIPKTKHNAAHWLASVNHALYWFPGVDGVKPGDTDNAGLCQVISDWRNGHHLLLVLLNTPNLVTDMRNLLDFGAGDFQWVQSVAYWDTPFNGIAGGRGADRWVFYPGAGHYIRNQFLAYFNTHGGLRTLGYPRTDAILEHGRVVQYFQGAKLIFDPGHGSVYPADLGTQLARKLVPAALRRLRHPGHTFGGLYKRLGGTGVLGRPVTNKTWLRGTLVQFFQYGELASVNGVPLLVPVGDTVLHATHDLPATGTADVFPSTMLSAPLP